MFTLLVMLSALVLTLYFSFMTNAPKIIKTGVSGLFVVSLLMTHVLPGLFFIWITGVIIQAGIIVSLIAYIKIKVLRL
ncbi:hypothetical protein MNBD_GAMMA10-2987 [hydrothermal vent metagenome]|uniref:Uncharacterized protein n=1 Tax=hydrothermal vent metagenome TaxID=652676 RepID=A0A3B0YBA4_9ZZZZ